MNKDKKDNEENQVEAITLQESDCNCEFNEELADSLVENINKGIDETIEKFPNTDPTFELLTVLIGFATDLAADIEMTPEDLCGMVVDSYPEHDPELCEDCQSGLKEEAAQPVKN